MASGRRRKRGARTCSATFTSCGPSASAVRSSLLAPASAALPHLLSSVRDFSREVDFDAVEELTVDCLAADGDGLDRGGANELRQAPDAAAGPLEQVGGVLLGQ